MSVEPGQTLLHYRIAEKVGEGGMGVVWKAVDTSLDRDAAIKILPAELSGDAERVARLEREARLLASLTHGGIAGVYGLHESDGVRFIALELVPGEDLSERLARGPLPIDEAVSMASQIAEALTAAHDGGVIHRDLKPANVKLTPEGKVKVLDFGLAKALDDEAGAPEVSASHSPTMTSRGTLAGVILGTAAYMSPEQAKGLPVDRRADTWAFGCLLFEMLTGRRAFEAETIPETLAAVLRGEPDWSLLPDGLPAGVADLLRRCLTKEPARRLRDVGDARLLLDEAMTAESGAETADPPAATGPRRRELLAWLMVALLAALGGWLALTGSSSQERPREATRFSVELAADNPLRFIDRPTLALSPDGRTLAFIALDAESGQHMIHLRELGQNVTWPVPGSERAEGPFFSPDGEQIAYFADGQLLKISVGGGRPTVLTEAPNMRGGTWLADGRIVFSPRYAGGLWEIPAEGGETRPLHEVDEEKGERTYRWPDALPGGSALVYTIGGVRTPNNYDGATIAVFDPERNEGRPLIERASMARFLGPERLIFMREDALLSVGFDPKKLELVGEPVQVLDDVGGDPSSGVGYFALSETGTLAYVPGAVSDAEASLALAYPGEPTKLLPLEPGRYHHPRISADGRQIAFSEGRDQFGITGDVWIFSLDDETLNRFTFDINSVFPVWGPGNDRLTYARQGEHAGIFSRATDGSVDEEEVLATDTVVVPGSWSPDGKTLAYTVIDQDTDLYLIDRGGEPRLFEKDASAPSISPDGKYIAFVSPASGNTSVYVRRLNGEGKWQVSRGYGGYPRWTADGRRLFFIDISGPDRPLIAVDTDLGASFRAGPPKVILENTGQEFTTVTAPAVNWDPAPDGDRFVFVSLRRQSDSDQRIEMVLDWPAELDGSAEP